MRKRPNASSLQALCAEIADVTLQTWLRHARQGTRACVPHLDQAVLALRLAGTREEQETRMRRLMEQARSLLPGPRHNAVLLLGLYCEQTPDREIVTALLDRLTDRDAGVRYAAIEGLARAIRLHRDDIALLSSPGDTHVVTSLLRLIREREAPVHTLLNIVFFIAQHDAKRQEVLMRQLRTLSQTDARLSIALRQHQHPHGEQMRPEAASKYAIPPSHEAERHSSVNTRQLQQDVVLLQHREPAQRQRAALRLYRAAQAGYRLVSGDKNTLTVVHIHQINPTSGPAHDRTS